MYKPALALLAVILVGACGDDDVSGTIDVSSTIFDGGIGGPDGDVTPTIDAGPFDLFNDAGQPLCNDKDLGVVVCECSDGINNDPETDDLTDGADPECSGPFDNDESSFATGIPGDNSSPYVQDCFFDGDSGGGNDGCRWDTRCEDVVGPDYEGPNCNNQQLEGCALCAQLTPNGCDCFGCCDVYVDGVVHGPVRLIDTCTLAAIDDPALCPPCEKVVDCSNPCDPCEVCLGHEPDPSCTTDDGGVIGPCAEGEVQCDVDGSCPTGFGCVTGCCKPIVP